MKASFVTLAVAGLAAAQNLEGVPPCIKSCIEKSLSVTGCTGSAQEIAACACKPETQAKLATPVTKCVTENKCDPADLVKAQGVSAAQCKAAGGSVPGSVPGSGNTTSVATTTTNTNTGTTVPTGVFPTNSSNHTTTGSSTEVATGTNTSPPTSTGSQTHTSGQPTATNGAAVVGPAAGAFIALFAAVAAL